MKTKIILTIIILLVSISSFSQEGNFLTTKATIIKIEKKGFGKRRKSIATIKYLTKKGDSVETTVHLLGVPFLGTFKSVGDEIDINYDPNNPRIAETDAENFLSKYGMYILIVLGILFSIKPFLKSFNRQK